MQGKGFVKLFTILLLLIVAYQVILLFPTWSVESAAEDFAHTSIAGRDAEFKTEDDKKAALDKYRQQYLDSVSSEKVFLTFTYQSLKKQQLALGLDLKGGMSVVMQVDLSGLIVALSGKSTDGEFIKALEQARKMQKNTQTDFVTLFGRAFGEIAPNKKLASIFSVSGKLQGINLESSNDQVIAAIRREASETVDRTYKLLKERIDKFGVAQPVVSLDKTTDRITVELPGVTNPTRARQYLQATASLEFWDVMRNDEIINSFVSLNEALKQKEKLAQGLDTTQVKKDSIIRIDTVYFKTGVDSGKIEKLDTIRFANNADSLNNPLFKVFQPNVPNGQNPVSAIVGFAAARDTAAANAYFNSPEGARSLPKAARFAWSKKFEKGENGERIFMLYCINTRNKQEPPLEGSRIKYAQSTSDPRGGYAVSLSMDQTGAQEWEKMTKRNVGREVLIVLDNQVYSAPVVNEVIAGGNTQISGDFDATEAADLANILSIGKLPSKTEIIEEAIVGPSLGEATVRAGLIALVIGFLSVLIFMVAYYSFAGFISVCALLLNLLFIFSCLASFGTVLTLPGIAGIVLTIGMAVDANVIIFERIREEIRLGGTWMDGVSKGFAQSYSSIIDANVTTLITAFILFQYGLGPIKGFATVLMVGVISSVFTAVLVGRLMFDYWAAKRGEFATGTAATQNILANPNIDFMAKRKLAYAVSTLLIVAGLASIFTRGFELGVDLQGGRSYTVQFEKSVDVEPLKEKLVAAFDNYDKVIVKTFNESNQVKVTTSYLQDSDIANPDSVVLEKLYNGAKTYSGSNATYDQFVGGADPTLALKASSKVGPTIADDIQTSAYWTAILALVGIFGYIFIRFRKWQYSVAAIVALAHDVLITVGMFSLLKGIMPFSLEVNQEFIAAILTVIGYSINDTVIVFDRIRETVNKYAAENRPLGVLINDAINNTLSRTSMTSFTTLLVVILLFLFGGDGVRGFAFALLVGIGVGTYSSIFIASPLVADLTGSTADIVEEEPVVETPAAEEPGTTVEETTPKA